MSLDTISASYFGCAEAPVWIPNGFDITKVPDCKSCNLRLVSPVPGSGVVSPRVDGLLVDENPQNTLSVNGIQHNLVETVLMIGGAHRLPGRSEPCKAELACYFQSTRDFSVHICLSLPVDIGTGAAVPYFATLGGSGSGRPVLSKIVPASATYLLYRGADLRGRSARSNVPSAFCDPVKRVTAYYVCLTPIFMAQADYQRLVARAGANLQGPPKPVTPVVNSRLVELTSRVKGISIGAAKPFHGGGGGATEGPGYPTKALKCYRVDPSRDIVKDKVYIGGKGAPTTLKEELAAETAEEGILPGDIQRWLTNSIALIVSFIIAAFAFVYIFSHVFTNYDEAQKLYEPNPISAHTVTSKIFPKGLRFFPLSWFNGPAACPESEKPTA